MQNITKEIFKFYIEILNIDSTSGRERALSDFIKSEAGFQKAVLEVQEVGDGTENLFFKWGVPKIVFCTHLDTVPPYFGPEIEDISSDTGLTGGVDGMSVVKGRGACDAKGQIAVQYALAVQFEKAGLTDFGVLWVSGEETGSQGARKANLLLEDCQYVIVGEPTDNLLITAAKGTALYRVHINGKAAHSGYPYAGDDAVRRFGNFITRLYDMAFPADPVLGSTTANIGKLSCANPFNVVPYSLDFSLYVRTTFVTEPVIDEMLKLLAEDNISIESVSKSKPIRFHTEDGFNTGIVAFGSDAPLLTNASNVMLYGPGSILTAHTDEEKISVQDMEIAVDDLKIMYNKLIEKVK